MPMRWPVARSLAGDHGFVTGFDLPKRKRYYSTTKNVIRAIRDRWACRHANVSEVAENGCRHDHGRAGPAAFQIELAASADVRRAGEVPAPRGSRGQPQEPARSPRSRHSSHRDSTHGLARRTRGKARL